MKLQSGNTREEQFTRLLEWHRWFAWCPTRLDNGDLVWLRYVQRKGKLHYEADGDVMLWRYKA